MLAELLDRLDTIVSELASADLNPLSDDELLDVLRRLETAQRRLAPVDHRVLNSAAERGLPGSLRCKSLPDLLTELLRIDPAEARARVCAAESFGSRLVWSGGRVGPRFPDTAAALADGVISQAHALAISRAVDALPDSLVDEYGDFVEKTLLEHAFDEPPKWVAEHGRTIVGLLDQDGLLRDEVERERRRAFRVTPRPDGSSRVTGELTAECTEALLTALDALTKPVPDADGTPDSRTAGQRNHDALQDLCLAAMRARLLPNAGGVACTMMLTMDADSWITGQGTATTGHGYTVSAQQAKKWTGNGADARFLLVLLNKTKAIAAYSSVQRIFTEQQRLAIIARDRHCTLPGCHAPPAYCQLDHVIEWAHGGRTSVDNATLECTYDHHHRKNHGWTVRMIDGKPVWTKPPWLDRG